MERLEMMLVRLSLLESAVAAMAHGMGVADTLADQQEALAKDPLMANVDPECFALMRLIKERRVA